MTTSQAFTLAGEICYYYHRKSVHLTEINEGLEKRLGKILYRKFCEEIKTYFKPVPGSDFKKEFDSETHPHRHGSEYILHAQRYYGCIGKNNKLN